MLECVVNVHLTLWSTSQSFEWIPVLCLPYLCKVGRDACLLTASCGCHTSRTDTDTYNTLCACRSKVTEREVRARLEPVWPALASAAAAVSALRAQSAYHWVDMSSLFAPLQRRVPAVASTAQ
jgi:hypothetical protein